MHWLHYCRLALPGKFLSMCCCRTIRSNVGDQGNAGYTRLAKEDPSLANDPSLH